MPTTGLPPARANSVGLPGRMSMPWNRMPGGSRSAERVGGQVLGPDRRAARQDHRVVVREQARDRRAAAPSASSRDDAARSVTSQPAAAACARQRVLVRVAHLARARRLVRADTARCRWTAPPRAGGGTTSTVVTPNVASTARSCGAQPPARRQHRGAARAGLRPAGPRWRPARHRARHLRRARRRRRRPAPCARPSPPRRRPRAPPPVAIATASPAPTAPGRRRPSAPRRSPAAPPAPPPDAPRTSARAHRVSVHDRPPLGRQIVRAPATPPPARARRAGASGDASRAPTGGVVRQDPARLVGRDQRQRSRAHRSVSYRQDRRGGARSR